MIYYLQRSWTTWEFYTYTLYKTPPVLAFYSLQKNHTINPGRGSILRMESHKIALNLHHGHHGKPDYHENVAPTINFHTLAANFHTAHTIPESETTIHQRAEDLNSTPRWYIHAKHVTSRPTTSQVPQQHKLFLGPRCHFFFFFFLSALLPLLF